MNVKHSSLLCRANDSFDGLASNGNHVFSQFISLGVLAAFYAISKKPSFGGAIAIFIVIIIPFLTLAIGLNGVLIQEVISMA